MEGRPAFPFRLLFGVTIFFSACLLFVIQPLASKLILPWFGGSAAVWITCLLFFQGGLLLGYLYAHRLAQSFRVKRQALVHTALLILSFALLPILPNAKWQPGPGQDPTWRVLGVLATSAGLPYVMLSATSPLLQSWYAGAKQGALPYRYFALSNAGSLAALLAYPILIEPYLTGHQQAWLWSVAFALFATLCIATAIFVSRAPAVPELAAKHARARARPSAAEVMLWISLAACASTLLLVVTNLLTQNIAPMPLLWVLPLSIYLLTFILCFESGRWYKRWIALPLLLPALGCLAASYGPLDAEIMGVAVPLLSAALFVCCMACHGELARLRPAAGQLTTFYVCLSAGGAIGGVFIAVFAPHVFSATYEYPIAFVGCAVLFLFLFWRERRQWLKASAGMVLWFAAVVGTLSLAVYMSHETWRNIRLSTLLARNFYGALRVDDFVDNGHKIRELTHGTITHGLQFLDPKLKRQATTYYGRDSGIGLTWRSLASTGPLRMGIVGLGTGTLASYGRLGDTLRFYDINPLIVKIAASHFSFLSDCPAHIDVVLGDARLSMSREDSQQFDVLVIDAFSGDSIPVHLLTREALQIYWRHLKPDGVLAVHVSNHYLDLAPVVALAANELGKEALQIVSDDDDDLEIYNATYVLVTSRANFFKQPLFKGEVMKINIPRRLRTWTDDYSNLWQVLKLD